MGELLSRVEGATRLTYGEAFQAAALLCQGQQELVAALLDSKMARQRQRPWQQRSGGFTGTDWQVVVACGNTSDQDALCSPSLLLLKLLLLSCCFACQSQMYSHSVLTRVLSLALPDNRPARACPEPLVIAGVTVV